MSNTDYIKTLSENIATLRKNSGLTQEGLASQLGLSFQAVSKWENGQSSPDITLLPQIAKIFNVSIDGLFGVLTNTSTVNSLPWEDDDVLRTVVFKGNEILKTETNEANFTFEYKGEALNVISYCDIVCNSITNGATASGDINCSGDIGGVVTAGGDINISGAINGGVSTGGDINCNIINGGANSSGDINCDKIEGGVECRGDLSCTTIDGNVICNGDISYR